jgi:uncharacterized protein (TIGR02266 family)
MTVAFTHPNRHPVADSPERRAAQRTALDAEISLESESQFFTALGGNLSTGGVFVATYQKVPIGAHVDVVVALPDGALHATGTVRWIRDVSSGAAPGLGIAFERIALGDVARVERFCAARAPLLHDDA